MIDQELAQAGLPPLTRHAWVEVDVTRLARNIAALRRLLPSSTQLGIVVKADGYGHGIEMASQVAERAGADTLLVATLDEALRVRELGSTIPLHVLFPVPADGVELARAADVAVTLGDAASAHALARSSSGQRGPSGRPRLAVRLEIDSGMTRGGLPPAETAAVARVVAAAPGLRLAGIWSHLAAPEDPAITDRQVADFELASRAIAEAGVTTGPRSLGASGALLLGSAPTYDMVRVGIAAYGVVPEEFRRLTTTRPPYGLEPALSLKAHPVRVASVPAGTHAGYGWEWRSDRPTIVATLPLGYADGYGRRGWPGAVVLVRGRRKPLAGRVSMDAVTVDVGDLPDVGPADEFVLLGSQGVEEVDALELARVGSTIPWDVISALSARLPRVYREDGRIVAMRHAVGTSITWASGRGSADLRRATPRQSVPAGRRGGVTRSG